MAVARRDIEELHTVLTTFLLDLCKTTNPLYDDSELPADELAELLHRLTKTNAYRTNASFRETIKRLQEV